jgi:uncharacterized cupin superfamily protein
MPNNLNRNVGIGGLDRGLCMIPSGNPGLFEIDKQESGLKEATIKFACFDPGPLEPARGTKCTDFVAGNDQTRDVLALFPYLACQTSKILVNSEGDGVNGVDVTVQGAIFDYTISAAPIASIPITNRGEYTALPLIVFTGGDPSSIARAEARLSRKHVVLNASFPGTSYSVGDVLTFVGGVYDSPVKVRVDSVDSGEIVTFHVLASGRYSVVPANNVQVTGGSGSGARFTVTWNLGVIIVSDGGLYASLPAAVLVGDFVTEGTLGPVIMGPRQLVGLVDGSLTKPFDPVTTVKDTVEFPIYGIAPVVTVPDAIAVRACATALAYEAVHQGGRILVLQAPSPYADGSMPPVDGVRLNTGDHFLINDGTAASGIWKVHDPGSRLFSWSATRAAEMDESTEVNNTVKVNASEGLVNSGLWQCTNAGSFSIDVDPITFDKEDSGSPTPLAPSYKVTIEYYAIELSFEYVAEDFAADPRFLLDEYTRNANGKIIIDPISGKSMALKISSVRAISQSLDDNNQILDGPEAQIDEATWRAAVKYVGDASQFEQTPAGAYWHVKETATIKIEPIIAAGAVGGDPGS